MIFVKKTLAEKMLFALLKTTNQIASARMVFVLIPLRKLHAHPSKLVMQTFATQQLFVKVLTVELYANVLQIILAIHIQLVVVHKSKAIAHVETLIAH